MPAATQLHGRSLIGGKPGGAGGESFSALSPATGARLEPQFIAASAAEVRRACELAASAFQQYSRVSPRKRAEFLVKIAENIEALGEPLVERVTAETALPPQRVLSERGRTCMQLRFFAQIIEEGSWADARIDRADPDRKPLPKPDVRSMLRPLGPVAIFGASNFPLAFSVAGGDTASALAAGNPVVVKAHPAHPGTSEMVGQAIAQAVSACGLHEGVFSLLFDSGTALGAALVSDPAIKAVGFTGSRAGGQALAKIAAARPEPIPIYAEMSSTNPVFILPGAMRERWQQTAAGLQTSFTMGGGQFCTKPGIVFVPEGNEAKRFAGVLQEQTSSNTGCILLTQGIQGAYGKGLKDRKEQARLVAEGTSAATDGLRAVAVVFETDAATFLANPKLADELFGPSTLLVHHERREDLLAVARQMEGQLTATIHGTEQDLKDYADLIAILEQKAGRILFNGFPTGVEVCNAMVHGGPYPATSDARTTSVGARAIVRFARPVCFQGFPNQALPQELQDENPRGIWRLLDGQVTRESAVRESVITARG